MKTLRYLLATISAAMLCSLATSQAQLPGLLLNDADRTFLREAAQGAAFESIGGQLAGSNSNIGVVRKLGNRITRANVREGAEIRALALSLGLTISVKPSDEQAKDLKKLGGLFYTEFARTYVNTEITTILNDIRDSLVVIRDGNNLSVRAFARRRLPGLNSQLQLSLITAQQIGLPLR